MVVVYIALYALLLVYWFPQIWDALQVWFSWLTATPDTWNTTPVIQSHLHDSGIWLARLIGSALVSYIFIRLLKSATLYIAYAQKVVWSKELTRII